MEYKASFPGSPGPNLSPAFWFLSIGAVTGASSISPRKNLQDFQELHLIEGTLLEQLEDIATGKISVYKRKKSLLIYVWIGTSVVLGVALIFSRGALHRGGPLIRTIVGIISILPFIYFVSIGHRRGV